MHCYELVHSDYIDAIESGLTPDIILQEYACVHPLGSAFVRKVLEYRVGNRGIVGGKAKLFFSTGYELLQRSSGCLCLGYECIEVVSLLVTQVSSQLGATQPESDLRVFDIISLGERFLINIHVVLLCQRVWPDLYVDLSSQLHAIYAAPILYL